MTTIYQVSSDIDLVYSPDDEGWYFQDYHSDMISQLFATRAEALDAWCDEGIVWGA